MGNSSFGAKDWSQYSTYQQTTRSMHTAQQLFTATGIHPDLDVTKFMVRESRHSAANPASTSVILGLDITGSMGDVAVKIAKEGLGVLIKEILERKPVSDPHIAFVGIGDARVSPYSSIQLSQFEADITMLEQLQKLWVAGGGGGNGSESYTLPWHLAAYHTSTDCYEKDGRKGFLFTFGDDGVPPDLTAGLLRLVYGRDDEVVCSNAELLEQVSKMYHVFHLMIDHDGYRCDGQIRSSWENLLGERAIQLTDYTKLAEVIVSIMQVVAGVDKTQVAQSWGGGTDLVVANSIRNLPATATAKKGAVVRF